MPRILRVLICAVVALTAVPAAASAGVPLRSDNVRLVGKLPDAGTIGARFSPNGRTMYVTSAGGLAVYDIAVPAQPQLLSRLPLPHFENEDVDVGRNTAVITNDPSFSSFGAIYLIDVSDRSNPRIRSVLPTSIAGGAADGDTGNGHIASCIQGCNYLYTTGTSEGLTIYDIRNLDSPRFVKRVEMPHPRNRDGGGFTHDVNVGPGGVAWVTGEDGTFGFDTTNPLTPRLVWRSDDRIVNTGGGWPTDDGSGPLDFLHHNSMRIPGGLAVTEEDYLKPTCKGQGSLQTWGFSTERNADGSARLKLLDQWTTELNELADMTGRSPATGNCSAHWFDHSGGLLAQGWYDQGVRFLDVSDKRDIRQVGYYASQGTFWGAYFAPTDPRREIVYAIDFTSGVDVLKIDRGSAPGEMPTMRMAANEADLYTDNGARFVGNQRWGLVCQLPRPGLLSG